MIGAEQPMGLKFIQRSCLTAIPFNWSPAGNQFSLSRFSVKLSRKFKQRLDHCLAACEIRKSTIRKAGNGVFISEAAMKGQILFKYGGRRISFPEADRLSDMVRAFSCFVFKCIQLCYTCIDCNRFAGTGYSHKGNFHSCVLLWLEAELSVQDGVVCAEPSCRWIPQLQYKEAVQRKIFDSRGRSFCCCNRRGSEVFVHYKVRWWPQLYELFSFPSLRIAHVLMHTIYFFAQMTCSFLVDKILCWSLCINLQKTPLVACPLWL